MNKRNEIILLKLGETVLKGLNRREFENRLIQNIKRRLQTIGDFKIYAMQSTVYVEPVSPETSSFPDLDDAFETVRTVFGIASVARAAACGKDKDEIVKTASVYLEDELKKAKSFKVESKRADKRFPMNSIELSQYVGGGLHDMFRHLTADMHNPELIINVEIREHSAYVHGAAVRGAGGLPVGTGGKMTALLSGGIDSPVAMYMMARRGVQVFPVHFYSHPYTSVQAKEKVLTLSGILGKYCGAMNVRLIPFTEIQEAISKNCPGPLMTVITRRFMMRIAARIAKELKCSALITGDNLGQVASQTVDALSVCDKSVDIPVFRPLLAFDKIDIISLAREIGTFETSILPFEDCCTVFTPRRPHTKPRLHEAESAEAKLDVEGLIERAYSLY